MISIIGTLRHYHSSVKALFASVKNHQDAEEYEVLLADVEKRELFYEYLCGFGKHLAIALESEQIYHALKTGELERYKRDMKFWQELRKSVKLRYSASIDHKEYEPKMQKLMDQYIAAEEVIRITHPVDILDEQHFEEELKRLGSDRAKADAIMTRISKRINAKWDENPSYYKKFSERIEATIQEYKDKRISEAEYLKRMMEIKQDFRRGYTGVEYPECIRQNSHAQAFYGVICEEADEYSVDDGRTEILALLAMDITSIIEKHSKVDWHNNPEVHNKIAQEIDDLMYRYEKQHGLHLSYDQIDKIIENVKMVARTRY
ncbi:type I restriction enzyme endonuclease domain-containing protein [Heliophilum fasciatum]|uniref:type I restriction enzyme endonuclease domain-containing protein n=1 Tax=Heliophilum fasciatum TaxID=35700 RepID=UPI0024300153|nr:type I restriction enzyme endonuclease domain-containing protein [Heliophilum fasciatum]